MRWGICCVFPKKPQFLGWGVSHPPPSPPSPSGSGIRLRNPAPDSSSPKGLSRAQGQAWPGIWPFPARFTPKAQRGPRVGRQAGPGPAEPAERPKPPFSAPNEPFPPRRRPRPRAVGAAGAQTRKPRKRSKSCPKRGEEGNVLPWGTKRAPFHLKTTRTDPKLGSNTRSPCALRFGASFLKTS